jgi:diacylglycerol kinase family enzyme
LVLLNPFARGGKAKVLWSRVASTVSERLEARIVETDREGRWTEALVQAVRDGVRVFIAAGGDGTVGALVNALMEMRGRTPVDGFVLGAVGLGSNNDFHKPFRNLVAGIPLRVDPTACRRRDVGVAHYLASDGSEQSRHFVVSASMGILAEGNLFFNQGDHLLKWLKARWIGGALFYTTLRTVGTYRNGEALLRLDSGNAEGDRKTMLTQLSVLKTPYVSAFRFDTPVMPDDGHFAVNLYEGMSRWGLIRGVIDFWRGRFLGLPGRHHWRASRLTVETPQPVALELDGEVVMARRVTFEVLPGQINQCG